MRQRLGITVLISNHILETEPCRILWSIYERRYCARHPDVVFPVTAKTQQSNLNAIDIFADNMVYYVID